MSQGDFSNCEHVEFFFALRVKNLCLVETRALFRFGCCAACHGASPGMAEGGPTGTSQFCRAFVHSNFGAGEANATRACSVPAGEGKCFQPAHASDGNMMLLRYFLTYLAQGIGRVGKDYLKSSFWLNNKRGGES